MVVVVVVENATTKALVVALLVVGVVGDQLPRRHHGISRDDEHEERDRK